MSDITAPQGSEIARFRAMAHDSLAQRMIRCRHFDRQAFGGQRWDLMLALFAQPSGAASVDACGQLLHTPPATTLALARILAGHGLLELGDSDGGWSEIPINLSAQAKEKMIAYFTDLAAEA